MANRAPRRVRSHEVRSHRVGVHRVGTNRGRWLGGSLLWVTLGFFASVTRAEVGVFVPPAGAAARPYVEGVTDDPDPILRIWRQVRPAGGSGHRALNPDGDARGDGAPSLVFNPASGISVATWSRRASHGFDVVVSRFENGAWAPPTVLAGGPDDELDPTLAIDPTSGELHLFYWIAGADPHVLHSIAPPNGASWSAPVRVSDPGLPACRPAGGLHQGTLYVVFEGHPSGLSSVPREIVLAEETGAGFVAEVLAVTYQSDEARPRVHSHAGRLWVDWIDAPGEAAWVRDDGAGGWEPLRFEPFQGELQREFHVRGAIRKHAIE